jgi:RHS repeat-associated protein
MSYTTLCHYRYDPLDRLINHTRAGTPAHLRFYCKGRLVSEIQGAARYSIVQHGNLLLAQQQSDTRNTTLLAIDQQRSVLRTLKSNNQRNDTAYTPYGHCPENGLTILLGFNGERRDPVTGHYLLGNGNRAFNPVLLRFNSPDNFSPFGSGGLNVYAYCWGDPINGKDPTGNSPSFLNINTINKIMAWLSKARKKLALSNLPISGPTTPSRYTHLAYHGTSQEQLPSLLTGLNENFMGSRGGQKLGEGFYSTDSFDQAVRYARNAASKDKSPPVVVKTYVKDLQRTPIKTPEQGEVVSMENFRNPPIIRDDSVYMIPPQRYKNVVLIPFENPAWVADYRVPGRRNAKKGAYDIRKR